MKKHTISDSGILKQALIYGCSAVLVAVVLAMLGAYLIISQVVNQANMPYFAPIISAISILVCTTVAVKKAREKKILVALGLAGVYFVIALLAKIAFFPGESVFMMRNAAVCVIAALVPAILICLPKKKKGRGTIKKR